MFWSLNPLSVLLQVSPLFPPARFQEEIQRLKGELANRGGGGGTVSAGPGGTLTRKQVRANFCPSIYIPRGKKLVLHSR